MKINLAFFSLLVTAMVMLVACGGGDDAPTTPPNNPNNPSNPNNPGTSTTLDVSPSSLTFDVNGGTQNVVVSTNASGWSVTSDKSWCTTSKETSSFKVTVTANSDAAIRTATITVKTSDGKAERRLTVTQTAASTTANYIRPVRTLLVVSSHASKIEEAIRVETNLSGWTCRSDQEWCQVRCDATNVYIFVIAHQNMQERNAKVTLSHEGVDYAQITVTQLPPVLMQFEFPDGKTLPVNGGSIKVKVYTNVAEWSAAPASSNCWFTVTKTDNETLTLTCDKRQGTTPRAAQEVVVTADEETFRFTVSEASSSNEGYGYGDGSEWDD